MSKKDSRLARAGVSGFNKPKSKVKKLVPYQELQVNQKQENQLE